jgi:nicotinamidase-related amidase
VHHIHARVYDLRPFVRVSHIVPATLLDPKTTLVTIDLQKGLANVPTIHPMREVTENAARLAEAFRHAQLPVIHVTVSFSADGGDRIQTRSETPPRALPTSPDFSDLIPDLRAQPSDLRVTKRQWSAFYGTDLDVQLRRRRLTGIVLAGVATSIGVDSTARGAYEHGYNITFASDAMTDLDADAHQHSLKKIFPRIGELDSTDAIIALLKER